MRLFASIHLTLLLLGDISLAYFSFGYSFRDLYFNLAVADLIVGLLQFLPALIMLCFRRNRNTHFIAYIALSILTISAFIFYLLHDAEPEMNYLFCILTFAFLLAHYFVYVLYNLTKNRNITTIHKNEITAD